MSFYFVQETEGWRIVSRARCAVLHGMLLCDPPFDSEVQEALIQKGVTLLTKWNAGDKEDPRSFPSNCYPKKIEGCELSKAEEEEDYIIRCLVFEKEWELLNKEDPIPERFTAMAIFHGVIPDKKTMSL